METEGAVPFEEESPRVFGLKGAFPPKVMVGFQEGGIRQNDAEFLLQLPESPLFVGFSARHMATHRGVPFSGLNFLLERSLLKKEMALGIHNEDMNGAVTEIRVSVDIAPTDLSNNASGFIQEVEDFFVVFG